MSVTVLKPGLLTTVQDRGRNGYGALGVGHAGPMDDVAPRLANALVGNDDDAAALEITLLGPRLRFDDDALVALTGADFDARIGDAPLAAWRTVRVRRGEILDLGRARRGARAYLAIAGGFHAPRVLGSTAVDVNARIGRPLREGDVLATAAEPRIAFVERQRGASTSGFGPAWSLDPRPWFDTDPSAPIHLIRGRHFDALDAASRTALFDAPFRIAAESNRVGYRLDGPRLALVAALEIVSEPLAFGAVQLPPGGQPIALTAEHPVTGGYPRIGQIAAIDLPRLAQRRPGDMLRFVEIDLDEAQTRYLRREYELARLLEAVAARLE
ncbi:biotin-dependent carboxyltransferase family protein [Dokdonella sp.]|uniref:5-oxoprolinase subunit C family protein n=1 Tax=Dokdonella sp. TaxID=2291710 RepID=UPI001B28F61E|nr:biotin-dependent carboxyltransferase family protein [Dokdonella sp.]MBO9662635.1 biotin-dependent carboxyltransferase family protein [Dokdonella sp.]